RPGSRARLDTDPYRLRPLTEIVRHPDGREHRGLVARRVARARGDLIDPARAFARTLGPQQDLGVRRPQVRPGDVAGGPAVSVTWRVVRLAGGHRHESHRDRRV